MTGISQLRFLWVRNPNGDLRQTFQYIRWHFNNAKRRKLQSRKFAQKENDISICEFRGDQIIIPVINYKSGNILVIEYYQVIYLKNKTCISQLRILHVLNHNSD